MSRLASVKHCLVVQSPAPPPSEVVQVTLPCKGTSGIEQWPIPESRFAEWGEAFPGVDLKAEVAKMRLWLEDNPTKRKTLQGMGSFTTSWLKRSMKDLLEARGKPNGKARAQTERERQTAQYMADNPEFFADGACDE